MVMALECEGFLRNPLIWGVYLSMQGIRTGLVFFGLAAISLKDKEFAGLHYFIFQYVVALLRLGVMAREFSSYHRSPSIG